MAGGGFTGLRTAYYLRKADPGLRIAVFGREIAGFGASGRNGGWCSALFPAALGKPTGSKPGRAGLPAPPLSLPG